MHSGESSTRGLGDEGYLFSESAPASSSSELHTHHSKEERHEPGDIYAFTTIDVDIEKQSTYVGLDAQGGSFLGLRRSLLMMVHEELGNLTAFGKLAMRWNPSFKMLCGLGLVDTGR